MAARQNQHLWALAILAVIAQIASGVTAQLVSGGYPKKLHVTILYESFCVDSIRFMGQQLGPSYAALRDHIDIQFVPFGKSQSHDNGAQFVCQHGPKECHGNRLQSCVLQQTNSQAAQTQFAVCQMTTENKLNVKECANSAGLSADVDACMQSELGTRLQLEAERVTKAYAPSFVPTIIYDQVFNQELQDNSFRNFRGTVCHLLQQRGQVSLQAPECQ